jgi:hypothetical protein
MKNNLKEQQDWLKSYYNFDEDPVVKSGRENLAKLYPHPSSLFRSNIISRKNGQPIEYIDVLPAKAKLIEPSKMEPTSFIAAPPVSAQIPKDVMDANGRFSMSHIDMRNLDFSEGFFEIEDDLLPTLTLPSKPAPKSGLNEQFEVVDLSSEPDNDEIRDKDEEMAYDEDAFEAVSSSFLKLEPVVENICSLTSQIAPAVNHAEMKEKQQHAPISPSALSLGKATIFSASDLSTILTSPPKPISDVPAGSADILYDHQMKALMAEKTRLSMEICDVMEQHEMANDFDAEQLSQRLSQLRKQR